MNHGIGQTAWFSLERAGSTMVHRAAVLFPKYNQNQNDLGLIANLHAVHAIPTLILCYDRRRS